MTTHIHPDVQAALARTPAPLGHCNCTYSWCVNPGEAGHFEHWGEGATTAALDGPKSAQISCNAMVAMDESYDDEIILCVRSLGDTPLASITVGEGIGLSLTVQEAQQLRDLLDTALASRAELRGRDG
ncbi:hypothetical protein HBE99_24010 [Mycobacteroides chelonae]|uniref:hypothetical protein n=1 Tax=Mycobacteroides chelonae TaxID=1774 RepID=UPI00191090BE|nr:hypothetical protein [Mycobacteroides chelonae]QQG99532.1 hypothetical protein HBE99_24010 [Mycobacteroides chelonae]